MPDSELNLLLASMDAMNQSLVNATNVAVTQNINEANRKWQSKEADKARVWSSKQAEDAYARQLEYYDTRLSPKARMDQYKEAGVNPVMALEGTGSAPSSSVPQASGTSSPSGSAATPSPMGVFSMLDAVLSIQRQKADIEEANARTGKSVAESLLLQKELSWIDMYKSTSIESMKAGIKEIESNIKVNEQSVNESIQRVQESIKKMDVMDSQIEVNGALVDLHGSQKVLNQTRTIVENLNAQHIQALLPYVEARQEAEIALAKAQTDEAKHRAESAMYDANLKMLKGMVDAKLIDSSYYDSVIEQANWDVKYKKREYKWQPINDICHNVSMIAMGAGSVMHGGGSIMHANNSAPRSYEEFVETDNYGNRSETLRQRRYN